MPWNPTPPTPQLVRPRADAATAVLHLSPVELWRLAEGAARIELRGGDDELLGILFVARAGVEFHGPQREKGVRKSWSQLIEWLEVQSEGSPMTIFEILGAARSENCYSWLLHRAFTASTEFQERLIRVLDDRPDVPVEGWACEAQLPVRVDGRKWCPDLLFVDQDTRRGILVEVKAHAKEGLDQSCSYASAGFLAALRAKLNAPDLALAYWWLTPDGWRPRCEAFQPLTFPRVAAALRPCTFPEPRLSLLAQDFVALADELECRAPQPGESVRAFLEARRLLTYNHNLECFAKALQVAGVGAPAPVRQGLVADHSETGERLPYPYYQWILRDGDIALDLSLQGDQRDPEALTLSYQYYCRGGQQQRDKEEPGWTQRYHTDRQAYRDRLYRCTDQLKRCGWRRAGGKYAIAKKSLPAEGLCSEVMQDTNHAIAELLRVLAEIGGPVSP